MLLELCCYLAIIKLSGLTCWLSGKIPPAKKEMWVQSLGQEHPLEEEMVTHFNILAYKISWTEEPGGLQSMVLQRVRHD